MAHRVCVVCSKPFAGRRDALYDSVACKSVAYRSRRAVRLQERRQVLDADEQEALQTIRQMSELSDDEFASLVHRLVACHGRDTWLERLYDLHSLMLSVTTKSGVVVLQQPLF